MHSLDLGWQMPFPIHSSAGQGQRGHVLKLFLQFLTLHTEVCTDVILWPDTCMFGNSIICLVLLVSSSLLPSNLSHQG